MGSTNVRLLLTFTKWIKTHPALWRVLVNVSLRNIPGMTLKCTLVCMCTHVRERENNNIHETYITTFYRQPQTCSCHGCLSSNSARIKSCAAVRIKSWHRFDPPTPPEGVQGGEQKRGALWSWNTGRPRFQIVRYSQKLILWAQFLYLLTSREMLKFFMMKTVPCD